MTVYKAFPTAVVLAAYHNKPCAPFKEMRELLDYMTGLDIALWEIPRARAACAKSLERSFPWLPEMPPPLEFKPDQSGKYVRSITALKGDTLGVPPLKKNTYKSVTLESIYHR